jgi:hypothetical protein
LNLTLHTRGALIKAAKLIVLIPGYQGVTGTRFRVQDSLNCEHNLHHVSLFIGEKRSNPVTVSIQVLSQRPEEPIPLSMGILSVFGPSSEEFQ